MSAFGQWFVVDTNALVQIGRHRRATDFFVDNAVIPSEVLKEATGFPDIEQLRKNSRPTTPRVLDWLMRVMATVPDDDTKLVNLYSNKGGADPFLIATALDGRELDSAYLDAAEWILVTGDDAVRAKAEEFDIAVLSSAEFATLIDQSNGSHLE